MKLIELKNGYVVASYIQAVLIECKNYVNAPPIYNVNIMLNGGGNIQTTNFKAESEAKIFVEGIVRQMTEDNE